MRRWGAISTVLSGLLLAALLTALFTFGPEPPAQAAPEALSYVRRSLGHAATSEHVPMLVALHGLGDTPESFLELFSGLEVNAELIAVRAPDPWGHGFSWYPMDEPKRRGQQIRARADAVVALLSRLVREGRTSGKPVVTGFSQGGVLSFTIAATHPEAIHAAVPIAGALDGDVVIAKGSAPLPRVLAFHGAEDRRIALGDARRGGDRLRAAGYDAVLAPYAGVGHGISNTMRRDLFRAYTELLSTAARSAGGTP